LITIAGHHGCHLKTHTGRLSKVPPTFSQAVSSAIKITTVYYSNGTINDSAKATVCPATSNLGNGLQHGRSANQLVSIHSSGATRKKAAYLPGWPTFSYRVAASAPPLINDATIQKLSQSGLKTAIDGIALAVQSAKGA